MSFWGTQDWWSFFQDSRYMTPKNFKDIRTIRTTRVDVGPVLDLHLRHRSDIGATSTRAFLLYAYDNISWPRVKIFFQKPLICKLRALFVFLKFMLYKRQQNLDFKTDKKIYGEF